MAFLDTIRNRILPYWKTYVVIGWPLLLTPLLANDSKESWTAFVILVMAAYWMTEAIPLAITSLIPVVLFPLFGIMNTGKVCTAYMKETNMMFIGGLMVALSIEYCNLHKRIALRVLMLVGSSPRWLMAGFMITTMFLSMWISNTATTAMMVPIVDAVVRELFKDDTEVNLEGHYSQSTSSIATNQTDVTLSVTDGLDASITDLPAAESRQELTVSCEKKCQSKRLENVRKGMMLSVAYSANLGGTGSIIGSGTNLSFKGIFKECDAEGASTQRVSVHQINVAVSMCVAYAANIGGTGSLIGSSPQLALKSILFERYGSAPGLNFATWMAFNVPGMLINTFLAWMWLQLLFVGFKREGVSADRSKEIKKLIRQKYDDLGPMTFHEKSVFILFLTCVLLWFFRDPQFITGWSHLIDSVEVDDATAVMLIVVVLFIIPAAPTFWCFGTNQERGPEKPSPALLQWRYVQDRLPWDIVLLLGGGFAISDASKVSGLSVWIGSKLSGLSVLPPFAIMFVVCIMTATITEVASNTATANILLPILSQMAITIKVNPLFLMVPATVTCSYAFMLPVATPPNAIVFAAAKMNPLDMIKAGFLMNIICVVVICVLMETLGSFMFNIYEFPCWAAPVAANASASLLDCVSR